MAHQILTPDQEPLLRDEDVAERYSVTLKAVRRWTKEGRLKAVVFSPRIRRYRPADVEEFLTRASGRVVP